MPGTSAGVVVLSFLPSLSLLTHCTTYPRLPQPSTAPIIPDSLYSTTPVPPHRLPPTSCCWTFHLVPSHIPAPPLTSRLPGSICSIVCPLMHVRQVATHQLLDALDSWESFGGSGPTAKGARVYAGPYSLAPIAPRPIMVDTAADEIAYPDVTHRCPRKQQAAATSTIAGVASRLWRGWGS
jgi:hypothetical protein